jgi:drug/metabolite transporter (DMT)-like permease
VTHRFALLGALILVGAVWALTFPLTKIAILGGYRNFGIIFWSSVIAVLFLGVIILFSTRRLPLHSGALWRYVFVGLCGTILPSAASYTAAEYLPAGVMSVCMSLIPMMALPLAVAFGIDRPTPARIAGILLGLGGVLLIALPEASLPDPAMAIFIPLALVAAFFYALEGAGLGRIGRGGLDPLQLLCGASVLSAVLAFPLAVATDTWAVPVMPFDHADGALILSGVANAVAYAGYVWLVGRAGSVFAAQAAYIVTGFGVVWSILLLGEVYSLWIWAAMALIFLGLFLVQPRPGNISPLVLPQRKATLASVATPEER